VAQFAVVGVPRRSLGFLPAGVPGRRLGRVRAATRPCCCCSGTLAGRVGGWVREFQCIVRGRIYGHGWHNGGELSATGHRFICRSVTHDYAQSHRAIGRPSAFVKGSGAHTETLTTRNVSKRALVLHRETT
jgi:hypothetical protein